MKIESLSVLRGLSSICIALTCAVGLTTITACVKPAQRGSHPGTVRVNPKDGLNYVWVPAGTYTMGCSPGDSMCASVEKPSHSVTISKGFWMGQTEVTVGAYKRFAQATGRAMGSGPSWDSTWKQDNLPMVFVNWDDARSYCTWAGGRLPTEAEWEYAARAGTQTRYYFGNDADLLGDYAWYDSNSKDAAHPVGQKKPNAWGLYDMLGNVWEWCQDWYGDYPSQAVTDTRGPSSGSYRMMRGGSWVFGGAGGSRVSSRAVGPGDGDGGVGGFRCVREVIP
jgi:formylglycine-generating enzyme required for sulfatase activity